jgi:hypothetical protein
MAPVPNRCAGDEQSPPSVDGGKPVLSGFAAPAPGKQLLNHRDWIFRQSRLPGRRPPEFVGAAFDFASAFGH